MRRAQKTGFPDQCSYEYKNGLSGQKQDFFMNKLNRHSDNYRELMLLKIDIKLRHGFRHFAFFLKWLAIAAFLGVVCGLTGALFHYFIYEAAYLFGEYGFLLYFLPAAGLLTVFSYHSLDIRNDEGTNSILRAARAEDTSAFRVTPLIFIATFLTHLCGGSAGREGAALQIGGSLGSFIARTLKLGKHEQQMLVMCGMSATFCALFGTPLTAAFFAIEVAGVGTVFYAGLLPAVVASFIAKLTALSLGVSRQAFIIAGVQETSLFLFVKIIALGILCAMLSIIFCRVMHTASALYRKYLKNDYVRIMAGGFLVIILTLLSGSRDYNGSGMTVITAALAGTAAPAAFAVKMLMTAATAGAGFKGGEIIPAMFIGATFGCTAAPFLGLDPVLGAEICLVAFFCGVVNCPVSSLLLSVEFFGSGNFLLFGVASSVSYMLSGYYSLYSGQKFMNSKLTPTPISRLAK